MLDSIFLFAWTVIAYLIGCIPTGDVVSRMAGVKIRDVGNGNPGAANIFREVGRKHGLLVFGLDILKGVAATLPIYLLGGESWMGLVAMLAVLAGHIFPATQRFRGGTGMTVAMGTTAGLAPLGVPIGAIVAILVLLKTKNPGITGGSFFLVTPLAGWMLQGDPVGIIGVLMAGAIVFTKARFQYRNVAKATV